ncbi:MAG: hypothetical protein LC798_11015 [Chloroflexi bacterium]|nr:hypothetical protein [Chloroflexota bacterium]
MAVPNSTASTSGGEALATHTVGGIEYQIVMTAGPSGHIHDSLPTYYIWRTYTAGAQNQITLDVFNAAGSSAIVKLRKLFVHHNQSAITGVGHVFDLDTTTAVGTGGTAITLRTLDTTNPVVPAAVTARMNATGGATKGFTLFSLSSDPEETRPGASIAPMINWMPEAATFQDLALRAGEGFRVIQITANTAGVWGCLAVVTIE